jgi:tetratricopeptide (TPR) repeat protein
VTVALAIVAAPVFAFWAFHETTESQTRFDAALAARRSAEALLDAKQLAEGERRCRQAIEILAELAARSSDRRVRFEKATALETLALIQLAALQPADAAASYFDASNIWSWLQGVDPTDAAVRRRLAYCLTQQASLLSDLGRFQEAEHALERGSIVCREQIRDAQSDERLDRQLIVSTNQLGLLHLHTGRTGPALATLESAVQAAKELVGKPSSKIQDRELLIFALRSKARAYSAIDQRDVAARLYREARAAAEGLSSSSGSNPRYQDLVATLFESESFEIQRDPRTADEARSLLERAYAVRNSLVSASQCEPDYIEHLAQTCGALAESFLDAHSFEKAEAYQRMELSHQIRLTHDKPDVVRYRFGHGRAAHNLAELLRERGKAAEALAIEREAAAILASVYRENVLDADYRRAISHAYWTLCTLLVDRKDYRSAPESVAFYQSIEPNGFEEAHEAAMFLCQCIALCQQDREQNIAERESLERSYADRAIGALKTAVHDGFRDLVELNSSHVYDPLRGRSDFAAILKEIADFNEMITDG